MAGTTDRKRNASDTNVEDAALTIARGSVIVLIMLAVIALALVPLIVGGIKVLTGDYIAGIIMLLFAGFVWLAIAGWNARRYQGELMVVGLSLLALMGLLWAIFEDGYGPKAFMLSLLVTAGFMAALGFYNLYIAKRQPRMAG